jgi:hypothetical protein
MTKKNQRWDWLQGKWVLLVGLIASLITLFVFITGKQSIPEVLSKKDVREEQPLSTQTNGMLPTSLSTNSSSQSAVTPSVRQPPTQFIQDYYELISNKQYETAFSLLSNDFKERNHNSDSGGFQGYVDWWNSIDVVEVWSVRTDYEEGKSAKVIATIHYEPNSSSNYEDEVYFQLIYDSARNSWLIDATPFR